MNSGDKPAKSMTSKLTSRIRSISNPAPPPDFKQLEDLPKTLIHQRQSFVVEASPASPDGEASPTAKRNTLKLDTSATVTGGIFPGVLIPSKSDYSYSRELGKKSGDAGSVRSSIGHTFPISSGISYTSDSTSSSIGSSFHFRPNYGLTALSLPSPCAISLAEFKKNDMLPSRYREALNALLVSELRRIREMSQSKEGRSRKDSARKDKTGSKSALSKLNAFLKSSKRKKKTPSGTYHLLKIAIRDNRTSVACSLVEDLSPNTLRKKRPHETNRCFLYAMANGMESVCMVILEKGFPANMNSPAMDNFAPNAMRSSNTNRGIESLLQTEKVEAGTYILPSYFILAVGIGLDNVVRMMVKKANVNQTWHGLSPLQIACCKGNIGVIQILLDNGADPHSGIYLDDYALLCGLKSDAARIFQLMSKFSKCKGQWTSPDLNEKETAAIAASRHKKLVDFQTSRKISTLEMAAACGHVDVVRMLMNKIDLKSMSQLSMCFLVQRSITLTCLFVKNGAMVENQLDPWGSTCLHLAVRGGHLDMVITLLYLKAIGINCRGENNWTPLHEAYSQKHKVIAQYLIKNGADPTIVNNQDETPVDVGRKVGIPEDVLTEYQKPSTDLEQGEIPIIELIKKATADSRAPFSRSASANLTTLDPKTAAIFAKRRKNTLERSPSSSSVDSGQGRSTDSRRSSIKDSPKKSDSFFKTVFKGK